MDIVFVVYAVNDRKSFEELNAWLREVDLYTNFGEKTPRAIIANKIDVDDRIISTEEGQAFAERIHVPYLETSAKTGQNVQEILKLTLELTARGPEPEHGKHKHCSVQ